jgi:ribonuclease J
VRLAPGDVVAFSARNIPGNEKAIGRVMNHVARRGAEVVTDADRHIHVSGHGSAEELKLVLSLVKPRVFVPIHGEYRQLARHGRMARSVCPEAAVVMVQDGDVLRLGDGEAVGSVAAGQRSTAPAPEIGTRSCGPPASRAAAVIAIIAIQRKLIVERAPSIITRGLPADVRHEAMLRKRQILTRSIREAPPEERSDPGLLKERIRIEMQRLFRKRAGRRPLVLPVVMEV